ncbi:MAG: peptide ABC transporter substrate-binding protein [Chloroflexi bacterium]|nr:peptide ABC transporter substrate-binding protein [Chloroflexota bacterium]
MSRKSWIIIAIVAAALVALLLCGGIAAVVAFRYISRAGGSSGATTAATPAPAVIEAGAGGGQVRLVGNMPPTLDPAMVQDSTSGEYVVHLFSGLVALNAELEVIPALAERWDTSPDGRTLTFYLHHEAAFEDGKPIRAADVVASFERACSPELASPVALSYLDDIMGASEFAYGQASGIAGLEVVDEHTVRITIDSPKSYFLPKLTYPTAAIIDVEQAERDPDTWFIEPNESGPFALDEISRDRIVLVRNERYVGQQANISRATYDLAPRLPITQYETGEIDITAFGGSELDRVLDPYNPLHNEYLAVPELSVQYLALNVDEPPFDDPLVRQALAYAVDREKLATLVLNRTAEAAHTVLPPNMPGYRPAATGTVPMFDSTKARALLEASSYGGPDGLPPIAITVAGTTGHLSEIDRALLAMFDETLGIEMTIEQVEWADMLQDMNQRRFQVYSAGWIADYPDPQNFLDVQFHSASPQNHTGYSNSEVDRLLERARVEQDEVQRMALYADAERIILNDAPWISLTHGYAHYLVKPYIRGFRGNAALHPWLCDIIIFN